MHAHELLVRGALDRLEAQDIDGYVDCFTGDVVLTNPLGTVSGRVEFRAYHEAFSAFSSHSRRVEHVVVSGDNVAVWTRFGGTVAATGRSFEVEGCVIFGVRDGLVCSLTEYLDVTPIQEAFEPRA
jgi:ketosteroid isomerase-like protein